MTANSKTAPKIALVTGATSGIGGATARRFLAAGWNIVAVGRNPAALAALAEEAPGRVRTELRDLLDDDAIPALARGVAGHEDALDALINSAGVIGNDTIGGFTRSGFESMLTLNVTVPALMIQAMLPFLERRKGSVVNVSSVTGTRAFPGVFSYCVSKAALDQATRCAALELAARGIRVNAVNPGVVITELHRRGGMDATRYAEFLERSRTTHPLGRPGIPSEVAESIFFLAGESASFITGVTLGVDGGRAETCNR